ncbi:hypothetical protein Tco_0080005 [Tanacetum coccineum]
MEMTAVVVMLGGDGGRLWWQLWMRDRGGEVVTVARGGGDDDDVDGVEEVMMAYGGGRNLAGDWPKIDDKYVKGFFEYLKTGIVLTLKEKKKKDYATEAALEVVATSKETKVVGKVRAYYGKNFCYDSPAAERYLYNAICSLKSNNVSVMKVLKLIKVAKETISYASIDSLLLTPLCCDDIHDVTPRVSALAGCDRLVSEPLVIEK